MREAKMLRRQTLSRFVLSAAHRHAAHASDRAAWHREASVIS